MRLTKRQLKRIIREEYSRLKRRGLIKESMMDEVEDYIEQVSESLYHGDEMTYMELEDELASIMPNFDSGLLGNAIDIMVQRGQIEARTGADGLGVFMMPFSE